MQMKEKMPITPTPASTRSTSIEAESVEGQHMPRDASEQQLPNLSMSQLDNIQDNSDEEIAASSEPKMRANDVGVFYGEKQALKDVSIRIYNDLVTAFIGPSGCGKSTF